MIEPALVHCASEVGLRAPKSTEGSFADSILWQAELELV